MINGLYKAKVAHLGPSGASPCRALGSEGAAA
jgi:hypothetical protein